MINFFEKALLFFICIVAWQQTLTAKPFRAFTPSDTLHKPRQLLVHSACAATFGVAMIGLNYAWYANYPRSKFHTFNDNGEWMQIDKVGHSFTAYNEAYWSSNMYKWAGVSQRKSILYGAAVGMALQLTIETLDGFSAEWGFSMGDLAANTIGSGILVGQELLWKEQRILFKFSTHYRYYNEQQLANRANELYGKSIPERALKDYNAQSYWLSGNISSFIKSGNKFPKWLNIAVGYGADNLYGGYENKWSYDINGKPVKNNTTAFITYTRTDLKRYRQFYLSPDIDFSRIKTKSRLLKTLFLALNVIKIPMPTLTYNQLGNTKFHLLYF